MQDVCKLAVQAGTSIQESYISAAHRLGRAKKQGKARPIIFYYIVRFVNRRKKADRMKNKAALRRHSANKAIFINDDLTSMRFKLFKHVKEKCQHTFVRDG